MRDEGLNMITGLRTYTGKSVDVIYTDTDTICIEDIAHSLSNLCRFFALGR